MEDTALLVGRIIVGLFYLFNGVGGHVFQLNMLSGYAGSKGIPFPKLAVLGSGALLIAGSLSIMTGVEPRIGVACIVAFLVPVAFTMHNFWAVNDENAKVMEMTMFLKDIALAGSALMFLAIPEPWANSL